MYYVSKRTGWVIFVFSIIYCICAGWVRKCPNICWRITYREGHIKECIMAKRLKNTSKFHLKPGYFIRRVKFRFLFIVFDQNFNLYRQFLAFKTSKLLNGYPSATFQNETTKPYIIRAELWIRLLSQKISFRKFLNQLNKMFKLVLEKRSNLKIFLAHGKKPQN